ncbi:hypothetical protein [Nocardioides limicola]|uniref:hypothetical protein n=1 Tax=Nocardioides limicola TaxID=2803368 RepID=UPI00193B2939|nr:hypothetical protein [Nocardioides sp. DJM-14]
MHVLLPSLRATHEVLVERMNTASERRATLQRPRDRYPATDTFLSSISRHVAALNEVLVPRAQRELPDGRERAKEFTRASKQLERALAQVKGKLYGSTYSVRRGWSDVWDDVQRRYNEFWEVERALARDLDAGTAPDDDHDPAEAVYRSELKAPTRPHPYVPHRGVLGQVARRVCVQVDHFWDTTEGRMIPAPIRHHDRRSDGRMTQYLLADPHLDEPAG